ncbi:MAG: SLBB domain-containing protein [Candidatus Ozemobacteraceae bacterium]
MKNACSRFKILRRVVLLCLVCLLGSTSVVIGQSEMSGDRPGGIAAPLLRTEPKLDDVRLPGRMDELSPTRGDQGSIAQLQRQVDNLRQELKNKVKDEIRQERKQQQVRGLGNLSQKPYYVERLDETTEEGTMGQISLDDATLDKLAGERIGKTTRDAPRPFGSLFFENGEDIGSTQSESPVPSTYRLGAGDALKIIVWSEMGDETVYDVTVNPEGQVYVPIIGVLGVQGSTIGQFEQTIIGSLSGKFKHFKGQVTLTKVRTLQIFVTGEATKPGALMVSALSTAFHALYRAGGPTNKGSMRHIKLIRDGATVGTIDLYKYFLSGDKIQDMPLENGDTLFIPPVGDHVLVSGEVLRPAIYELQDARTLADVLAMAGGAEASAYSGRIKVFRWQKSERRKILDVVSAAAPKIFQLVDGDEIVVERAQEEVGNFVLIEGAVRRPGEYAVGEGTTIQDLVRRAGGIIDEETALHAGQITRKVQEGREGMLSFDLDRALAGDPENNLVLKPFDRVKLYFARDIRPNVQSLIVAGAIRRPGEYVLRDGMRVRDLVLRAQGLTFDAAEEAEVARAVGSGTDCEIRRIKIREVMKNPGNPDNLPLHPLDRVNILTQGDTLSEPQTVIIKGEVKRPGPYSLKRRGETLAEIIERAGGLTSNAFSAGTVFQRRAEKLFDDQQLQVVESVQEDMFKQANTDLRADLLRAGAKLSDLGSGGKVGDETMGAQLLTRGSQDASVLATDEAATTRAGASEKSRYSGIEMTSGWVKRKHFRIPIQPEMLTEKVSTENLRMDLQDGDEITIPSIPVTVAVAGAVVNPSNILFKDNQNASYYITRVGGFIGTANHGRTVVVRANGEVMPLRQVNRIQRGDIILVPPKANLVKRNKLQEGGSIAQMLGNLAVVYNVVIQK